MAILIFFIAHWYLSLFTQTFFLHRYAAHQMFTMSKGAEKVFYVLTAIFAGSSYLSPRAYAIMHRMHHAYADTDKDPHSPSYSKNLMDMMLKTWKEYSGILHGTIQVDPKFTKNVPDWPAFEKIVDSWPVRILWGITYFLFYLKFATFWWMFLLLPIHFFMGPVHGAIINWYSHKVGYTNFEVGDTSKNLLPVDILMLGESYHNNHHKYGGRANFGVKWHEFDPVYPFIKLFNALGIIHLKKNNDLKYM